MPCAPPWPASGWPKWPWTAAWTPWSRNLQASPPTPAARRAPGGAAATWWAATAPARPCASCRTSVSRAGRRWSGTPWRPCGPTCPGRTSPCCTGCRPGAPAGPRPGRSPHAPCRTGCGGWTGSSRPARTSSRPSCCWPGSGRPRPPGPPARPRPTSRWTRPPTPSPTGTPDLLLARVRETLAGWTDGTTPPYELLDTGVHTVHHRLARRWRADRVFLAGDAAHLLGALGTHGVDEGLRDADNLAWKLALAWHHGPHEALLNGYQTERRALVAARLRAADQVLPLLRGGGGLRTRLPGTGRGHDSLLMDGHLGEGPVGTP